MMSFFGEKTRRYVRKMAFYHSNEKDELKKLRVIGTIKTRSTNLFRFRL